MLSTFICWAVMPLAALKSARVIDSPSLIAYFGDLLDGGAVHVRAQRDGLLQHLELPHHAHETDRGFGGSGIGRLQLSLLDGGAVRRRGTERGVADAKVVVALFDDP